MKQTRWLSKFSCLSEYTRLYPILTMYSLAGFMKITLRSDISVIYRHYNNFVFIKFETLFFGVPEIQYITKGRP